LIKVHFLLSKGGGTFDKETAHIRLGRGF